MASEAPLAGLFEALRLADVHQPLVRNIVSLRVSQDLFDDLSDQPEHWKMAQQAEAAAKPASYRSAVPIIHRPFEDAAWFNAIGFPFRHWGQSRYSDGSFGVWYGTDTVLASVWETAYHWYYGLLSDAGFQDEAVVGERKVYQVQCDAALLDLRPALARYPVLLHPADYAATQQLGRRIHQEGHPGLVTRSVRWPEGSSYAVLNPALLSAPRQHSNLAYRSKAGFIEVETRPGKVWLRIDCRELRSR